MQGNHFDFITGDGIDTIDDFGQARDIAGGISNDNDIGGWYRCQVFPLRNQGTQDRHQLAGVHMLDLDDLRDQRITCISPRPTQRIDRILFGVDIRNNLDRTNTGNRRKAMHF